MEVRALKPYISADRLRERVDQLGRQISADYPETVEGAELWLVVVLKGAGTFAADLARSIDRDVRISYVRASSYADDTASSGRVEIEAQPGLEVAGADVVVVEDIVDTGRTANALLRVILDRGPRSVKIAALLDKPSRRAEPVQVEYRGFEIPDLFVVGYGLDFAERYRNLPDVRVLEFESEGNAVRSSPPKSELT